MAPPKDIKTSSPFLDSGRLQLVPLPLSFRAPPAFTGLCYLDVCTHSRYTFPRVNCTYSQGLRLLLLSFNFLLKFILAYL